MNYNHLQWPVGGTDHWGVGGEDDVIQIEQMFMDPVEGITCRALS